MAQPVNGQICSTPTNLIVMKLKLTLLIASALLRSPLDLLSADLTADHLTIQASATIAGPASFGTVHYGLQSSPHASSSAFKVSVAQANTEVTVPFTVEGHYEDGYTTVEDYGWIKSGRWQAQHSQQEVGTITISPVFDETGNRIEPERSEPIYGDDYLGDSWVDSNYWGIIGTHSEPGQVWVAPHQSSYTDYAQGVPKIQFTAARSDTNWAWQVPSDSGVAKDILVLWDGGLRLPSRDDNRMMALLTDSLTQSYQTPWDGNQEKLETSELRVNEFKTFTQVRSETSNGKSTEKSTSQLRSESIQFTREEQISGTASTVQTQIAAKSAHFGGVVQVEGDVKVRGVLRVRPAGDLDMGSYTSGPQP